MHLVERFADWAVSFRGKTLEKAVIHHARRAVIDWHAALYPGMVVPPVTLMQKAFAGEGESPRLKALIEGTAAHTVEVDDIYRDGIYHPGGPTIAASRALTEKLRSIVVGYEISTRIGAAMGKAHYKHWHNTGTIGCFGAAAAAAEALELDRKQFAH
ncbi:MAG TPA: MmgE/PrpD family protein, partial [Burkholderiales bacterium]|nr:MmgE/PrpD family protein [Burkholderiales bacterium]